jgi:GNAT superfamily N-acetyltransferase
MLFRLNELLEDCRPMACPDFGPDHPRFLERVNARLTEYGGYDFADHYGLEYGAKDESFVEEVRESLATEDITYRLFDELPWGVAFQFARAAGGSSDHARKAQRSEIKIGAFKGQELLGFIAGQYWYDLLSFGSYFVQPEYRGRGIGRRILYHATLKARQEGKNGVDVDQITWDTRDVLKNMSRRCDKNPWLHISWFDDDGSAWYGEIRFTDRTEVFRPKAHLAPY